MFIVRPFCLLNPVAKNLVDESVPWWRRQIRALQLPFQRPLRAGFDSVADDTTTWNGKDKTGEHGQVTSLITAEIRLILCVVTRSCGGAVK